MVPAVGAPIHKNIGWHKFRHFFGTLLKASSEDVKTVQEFLRHANGRTLMLVAARLRHVAATKWGKTKRYLEMNRLAEIVAIV